MYKCKTIQKSKITYIIVSYKTKIFTKIFKKLKLKFSIFLCTNFSMKSAYDIIY